MGVAPIKMPQLGESVTEGTVDRWLKKEGDFVKRDEPLVEVVTDKVNAEIPSPFEGRLVRISVAEGTTVDIGVEIAQIEVEGSVEAPAASPPPPEAVPAAPAAAAGPAPAARPDGEPRGRFSPAVRRLAEEHGLDPTTIAGTGEGGRVTRDDVLAHIAGTGPALPAASPEPAVQAAAPAPATPPATPDRAATPAPPSEPGPDEELVKLSSMRKSIAEHMVRSLATSPHAWTLQEVDMTGLVRYREAEKDGFAARHGVPLTYLPFVIQALSEALREHPLMNSSWSEQGVVLKRHINVGIAVSVPDGLIVPVIRDADRLGFSELAKTLADLVARARGRQLKPEEVQAGTFTLNNTGATGSIASQPIINQPQAAILTTEAIVKRPVVIGDAIAIRSMMNMCMSFDHRIVDGMEAGTFVGAIKRRLEEWTPASIRI